MGGNPPGNTRDAPEYDTMDLNQWTNGLLTAT